MNIRVRDIADFQKGFAFKSKDYKESGHRIIRVTNLNKGDYSDDNCFFIDELKYDKYKRYSLKTNDAVISTVGSWPTNPDSVVGKVSIIPEILNGSLLNQNAVIIRAKGICTQDYLNYLLLNEDFKNYIIGTAQGSANQASIKLEDIRNYSFNIPSIEYQKKVTNILKNIDGKIRINKKINENLAAQAQAIFKDWFIDTPDSVSWPSGTFSDIIENMIAGDWGKESPTGNNTEMVYCIRGADIPDVKNGNKGKMPTRFILPKNYAAKHLVAGDVVVEISGGSPTQSTGRIASISQSLLDRYDKGMVCTNFCKAMKPKVGYSMFVYYYWQYLYDRNVFFSYENGTTGIKNLDISGFIETEPIVLPPTELIAKFDALCHSMFDVIFANGLQNEQLANMRDSLLPKLMSGELDVSELDI